MIDETGTQREIRELVSAFAETKIRPHVETWERDHTVPLEVLGELGELGVLGTLVPESFGGSGLGARELCAVVEELARVDTGVSVAIAVHAGLVCSVVAGLGADSLRQRLLPTLVTGERFGAYCLTEPECGSDAAALRTAIVDDDGRRVLRGTKTWITNGGFAEVFVVFARDAATKAIRAVVAEAGEGLERGAEIPKLGLHTSSTRELVFDGLALSDDCDLGAPDGGIKVAFAALDGGRITIAAQACGIARAALDVAVDYARTRPAWGGPIARFQAVQFPLAELAAELDAARLLTYRAAELRDTGAPHTVEGAKAKLVASSVAVRAADAAVQTLGGYGYAEEYPAARLYRDARITQLYEGTSEIQKLVIARDLFGDAARG